MTLVAVLLGTLDSGEPECDAKRNQFSPDGGSDIDALPGDIFVETSAASSTAGIESTHEAINTDLEQAWGPFSYDPELTVIERIDQLYAQGDLPEDELNLILSFIKSASHATGLSDEDIYWLKNDLFSYLRNSGALDPTQLIACLAALAGPENSDLVLRDYALQHLSVHALQYGFEEEAIEIFTQGVQCKEASIAGTSLLAWSRMRESPIETERLDALVETAANVLDDDTYSEASRASALQVIARNDGVLASDQARSILEQDAAHSMLLVSAISALQPESNENKVLLQRFKRHADPRVARASLIALNKK